MEREAARRLRAEGYTLAAIAAQAGVSPTTVGVWCRGIVPQPGRGARDTQRRHREAAQSERERGRWEALELVGDSLWVAGTTMYWGEGSKTGDLRLSNTDPAAIRLFVDWVEGFHDPNAAFAVALHLHDGDDEATARAFWRHVVGRPVDFIKTYWKPIGTGHRRKVLPHGICTARVRASGLMLHRTLGWIEGLSIALPLRGAGP